jgi:hypothetical protein
MTTKIRQYLAILFLLFVSVGHYSVYCSPKQGVSSVRSASLEIGSDTFIEISLEGGGVYGGANPVTRNQKVITSNGTILIRYKQLYSGDKSETLLTSRVEVEKLAKFIYDNEFFKMKDIYDCSPSNQKCKDRKKKYPPAIPVTVSVKIGNLKKKVTVTVFEKGMIDYPHSFEVIVDEINEVVSQAK